MNINDHKMEELVAAKNGRRQSLDHPWFWSVWERNFREDGSPVRSEAVKQKSRLRKVRDREPQLDEQQGREGRQGEE